MSLDLSKPIQTASGKPAYLVGKLRDGRIVCESEGGIVEIFKAIGLRPTFPDYTSAAVDNATWFTGTPTTSRPTSAARCARVKIRGRLSQ